MTDTTIAPATGTPPAGGTASPTNLGNIAGNFNAFLTLLTTQLQHQDPLSPLDTNQFTSQLVQFASVEQQINMNTSLSTLISLQQTAQATAALGFIGATVVVGGNTAQLANGQASWNFAVANPATATINVSNASGQLVYSTTQAVQPGTQTFTWNGRNSVGNVMPPGFVHRVDQRHRGEWPAGCGRDAGGGRGQRGQRQRQSDHLDGERPELSAQSDHPGDRHGKYADQSGLAGGERRPRLPQSGGQRRHRALAAERKARGHRLSDFLYPRLPFRPPPLLG
jgi:flagellar basal-body rod modification protein FlgD